MKMLGSERGVVEEWLSEFKVCAYRPSLVLHGVGEMVVFYFWRDPHTVGVTAVM